MIARQAQPRPSDLVASPTPLVVDLDGTLLRSDLLAETFFSRVAEPLSFHFKTISALLSDKARLKHHLATDAVTDFADLPYDEGVLELIRKAKEAGRQVYLATAAHESLARGVAEHLGVFDGVFASTADTNLNRDRKAEQLVAHFGERGFDYAGNSLDDLPVWQRSRQPIAVNISRRTHQRLRALRADATVLSRAPADPLEWVYALRMYQYAKNLLIFVPLLTSHSLDFGSIAAAARGFVAFCLCASAVYVLNDLIDLRSDRAHPRKKQRSFAAGRLSPLHGICAIPVLLLVALAVAATVSRQFVLILLTYLALTTAYSFYLKRKLLVDIVVLSVLYTVRIFAGGVAIGVAISNWLAMFSLFFFTALALIKRYTELAVRRDAQLGKPAGRNYELDDLPVLGVLSAAAGLNAITIFTLYISSANVTALYRRPEALWLIAPLLLYWFARMLVMAHRRHLDDDPIVFAVRDRISLLTLACIIGLVIVAI